MGDCETITLDMVYTEIRKVNQRMAALEHIIIPEERLSPSELKEIEKLVADAKKGNVIPFSKIRK